MSFSSTFSAADASDEGGAMPAGRRLLGLVQRMMQTGMAMARHVNRIAPQRLDGQPLARLGPAGFNVTYAHALVGLAVAWTAALRERVLAVAGRPSFTPDMPKAERRPRGRSAADYLPDELPEPTADDWHNFWDLAKPVRMGPGGVAVAAQLMAGKSNREVVTEICDMLSRASAELGAEADMARIAELEAAARALCAEMEAPPEDGAADSGGESTGRWGAVKAGSPSDEAEDDPLLKEPPD